MAITEFNKLEGAYSILRQTTKKGRSAYFAVILVQRTDISTLAGCFLFDLVDSSQSQNAPALASSSSNPAAGGDRSLFQRLYRPTGVKASHWYQGLYAALYQRFLIKGYNLPANLLSAALLPEVRKAPDRVRSLPLYRCLLTPGAEIQNLSGIACKCPELRVNVHGTEMGERDAESGHSAFIRLRKKIRFWLGYPTTEGKPQPADTGVHPL
jgi:hypothetical protein